MEGKAYHWTVTALMLVWLSGAIVFQKLVAQGRWRAVYAWATLDVVMLTILLQVREGPQNAFVIGYFILIAATSLRFRIGLVWYVAGLCMASYIGLQVAAWRQAPERALDMKAVTVFVLGLATMGLIPTLLLRRFRAALAQQQRGGIS